MACSQVCQAAKIFVEDDVAKNLLSSILNDNLRKRVELFSIGSIDGAISQQVAASIRLKENKYIVVADGDQRKKVDTIINNVKKQLKNGEKTLPDTAEIQKRLLFLPGDCPPEKMILETILDSALGKTRLVNSCGVNDEAELISKIKESMLGNPHSYFYNLAIALNLDESTVLKACINSYKELAGEECKVLNDKILQLVNSF